jgi:hypothetical protein
VGHFFAAAWDWAAALGVASALATEELGVPQAVRVAARASARAPATPGTAGRIADMTTGSHRE